MAKKGRKQSYGVVVQGALNAHYFDYFWAFRKITFQSEGDLIREGWRKVWDALPEADKNVVKRFLEKNPSPRMEQQNKMKCE